MGCQVCPGILFSHYFDVVLLVRVLPLFVELGEILVQQPIGQFEILPSFLDIAVSPEAILSSADVIKHILDLVVATRLPRF